MKKTNRKTGKIASALAALSLVSAMAMPTAVITASADEIIEEIPEITTEETTEDITEEAVILHSEENEEESAVTTTVFFEELEEETTTTTAETIAETVRELTEKQKIRNYFDEEFADFDSDQYAGQLDYTQGSNMGVESRGKNLLVTRSQHVDVSHDEDTLKLTDTKSTVYPGALVKADDNLAKGNPRLIDIDRNDMSIRVEYGPIAKGAKRSRTVNLSSVTDVKDMIEDIENNCLDPDSPTPARFTFDLEKISSDEQLKAKAHLEQNVYGKLKIDAETGIGEKKQMVLLDFTQIYYTISADPQTKEKLFGDNVTLEQVQSKINRDNPAAFVSAVDYGRRVVACIETNDTSFDLKTEIEGSGIGEKIKGDASFQMNNKLSKCSVKYYVYGGSGKNSGQVITCTGPEALPKLLEAIANDTSYQRNTAFPVSYTTDFAHDGITAKVNLTADYYVNKTQVITPTDIKIETGGKFHGFFSVGEVETHTVKITGQKITGLDEYGEYTHGAEETIYQRTFGEKYITDGNFREIPAEYDLATVRVYFDYTGNKRTGFRPDENGIRLTDLVKNPEDISSVTAYIESTDGKIILTPWATYDVYGKVTVTDKSGKTYSKQISDQ